MSKGSKRRIEDFKTIQTRWDEVDWSNSRRNKLKKMFPDEVQDGNMTCQVCGGKGKFCSGDSSVDFQFKCSDCNGSGKISLDLFKAQLGIVCDKCGLSDAMFYSDAAGRCICHHTHKL